ncbi:MAG: putative transposase [Paraglaciecola sp.]
MKLSLKKRPKLLTPQGLNDLPECLNKLAVEAALNAEMEEHLFYEKHAKSVVNNSRHGMTIKRMKTGHGQSVR